MKVKLGILVAALVATPALAQTPATWNGLPDRFQLDTGYFRLDADTTLRLNGPDGSGSDVDFEKDLAVDSGVNTFWIDGTWRVGRRHQLKLAYTRLSRERANYSLQRDFSWGGSDFSAGLEATTSTSTSVLGGYYRFAVYRNDRFEIGPAIGVGYLWLEAAIEATGTVTGPSGSENRTIDRSASTGSVTGAIGGYVTAWPAKRLSLQGDYLYIKVKPGDSEAAVTDWRVAADLYLFRSVGVGVQYKYYRYSYDRGIVASKLGGEITLQGAQVYASFRF
jgi:hypothetical protein